jgi:uncharacterized membrane protein
MWLLEQTKGLITISSRGVEVAAALIIAFAALEATIKAVGIFLHRSSPPEAKTEIRLTLGRWLAVGLEFLLAADILRTAVAPTWNEIGQLAAIAALRTALNYFLGKEIDKEATSERGRSERNFSSDGGADDEPGIRVNDRREY